MTKMRARNSVDEVKGMASETQMKTNSFIHSRKIQGNWEHLNLICESYSVIQTILPFIHRRNQHRTSPCNFNMLVNANKYENNYNKLISEKLDVILI